MPSSNGAFHGIKDAVAVITGSGSGIGEAVAKCWVEQGGKAVLGDVSLPNLDRVAADIAAMGGEAVTMTCDVTRESDTEALAKLAIEKFGAINLVVPCAGIIIDGMVVKPDRDTGRVKAKMSLDNFRRVIDINLVGVFLTVRDCLEQMINHQCRGMICTISSTGSLGTAGQINYSSTKAAMSVFPKVLTAELFRIGQAGNIRANAVAPGYVGTPMVRGMKPEALAKILEQVPGGRLVDPEEVAALIFDLYRNEAISGEVYFIHNGLRLGSRG